MEQIRPSNGPRASLDRDGDDDESRPQSSLLPATGGHIRQQKQNFWLRRTVLMAFSFLFIACALALIGVSRHITAQNGLPLSLSSSSYSWTYGPTGVLVLILALWRQVDYNCRSMQPWWEMAQGPSTAARSVLLDYVSPFQPMACFSALKNGHYAVFISILSFLVLRLIILLSTTLFVVEPTWHLEPVSFRYQNAFNTEYMWNSPEDNSATPMGDIGDRSRQGDVTVWSYMATLNNATAGNLGGTKSRNMAYQSLIPPQFSSNISSISTVVDVFVPSVTCEEASLSLPTTTFGNSEYELYYRFDSPSCSPSDMQLQDNFLICKVSCKYSERPYSIHRVDCGTHDSRRDRRSSESSEPDLRYAISVADLSTAFMVHKYNSVSIQRASAAICKVGYGMVSANATWDALSGLVTLNEDPELSESPRHLPNMTNHDLAEILLANLYVSSATLLVDPTISPESKYAFAFFQLLAAQLELMEEDDDALFQPSILGNLSTAVFEGISVEFAKKALLVENPDGDSFEAIAHVSENRLHLRHYTLWPIVSCFFLLSVFCGILSLLIPSKGNQPYVSGSIASYASVLMKSPSLLAVLKDTGYYRSSQLRRKLESLHFIVNPSKYGPRIEVFESTREVLPLEGSHKKRPWLPLAARLPMVVQGFVLPLLMVVLLEILQRLSDRRHGLLDLDSSSSATLAYAVRLTSTLFAFLVATLFNNLDFSIAVFAPFSFLRSGNVTAQRSILFHLLGVSPLFILVDTLRLRQFGSAASNLSIFLASFLTIVVSGLWVMGNPTPTLSVSTATVRNWNASWLTNDHDDRGASIALNIIRHGGATTARSIQGYNVLPIISLGATQSLDKANTTFETTVLRPVLDCDSVPTEEILVETTWRTVSDGDAVEQEADILIAFNQTVSSDCSPKSSGMADTGDLVVDFQPQNIKESDLNGIGIGQYWDLDTTPGRSDAACPSTAILFGALGGTTGNGTRTGNSLTALFCSHRIEEVPATITYKGNPSNIDLDDISVHPERARSWTNGTKNSKNLAFKLQGFLDSGLTKFPVPLSNKIPDSRYYDVVFNHIVFGPRKTLPTDMLGPSNIDALTEAITHSFKEYLAHVIDLNFRSNNSETSIQGTSLQTTTRLAMHKVSKIILQALLVATTVLSFVGYCLVKIRGTLPRNPCSIASTMGFLADSQLCDPKTGILPKDASLMTERELRQSLHGFVFSLGWWERSRDSEASRPTSPSGEESSDLDAGDQQEVSESTYFGIDVGHTNALGFSKKEK